jgi:NAD-specific glutamate dehydrogenase
VSAFNPSLEERGFQSTHTIVEIVNDDMPFLVDSVTTEVNRHGLTLHLIVHPVIAVLGAAAGLLRGLAADTVGKATRESFIHVEVDRITDAGQRQCLEADIDRVLDDVRAAIGDWKAMRAKLDGGRSSDASAALSPDPIAYSRACNRNWRAASSSRAESISRMMLSRSTVVSTRSKRPVSSTSGWRRPDW